MADDYTTLVTHANAGDQAAISELYEATYSQAYYTVRSMIRDEDAVFDILQDAYIKAFSHLDSFEGGERFEAWIRQIAANTARDWLKKKRPLLFSELAQGEDADIPAEELFEDDRPENLPEEVLDQKETARLIREILEDLPEDQRAAIGMFYYEDMSVKEIAQAMGATENAVKSRLLYGRRKIEAKVRDLEKKGTKLYGLAPIPFLLLLLRSEKAYATEIPNEALLQGILRGLSAAKTTAAAGTAAQAAKAAGTAAAGVSSAKIAVAVIAAIAVLGAGAIGIARHSRSGVIAPQDVLPVPEQAEEPVEPEAEEPEEEPEEDAVAAWTEAEEAAGRLVFTGEIATYTHDEVVEMQGFPDYNGFDPNETYRIIVLDELQEVTLGAVDGARAGTLRSVSVRADAGVREALEGGIVFSIDPETTWWPSDTSIPLGQPKTGDIHVME
ncbi:MAG: sigma-70 family RNA polymerase sigma factor [Firmicutes bacterium]|nr:sigma-70 family RNA polymerase sigma factor [Bacillota bacterium]